LRAAQELIPLFEEEAVWARLNATVLDFENPFCCRFLD